MSTRMVLSIAFVLFVVLGMLVYITQDNRRADTTLSNLIEEEVESGAELFAANCSQCHGPKGEGAIGPALDREEWHAENKSYDDAAVTTFLRNVLNRGQHSPQPGIQMPAWALAYGGPFNDQQIEDVVAYITHGNWNMALPHTASPNFLADIPANEAQKKQYPIVVSDLLLAQNPQLYSQTGTAAEKKTKKDNLEKAAKEQEQSKGPLFQQAEQNKEKLRLLLGNRDPNKPGEKLNGLKQLLMVKGCIGCHGFGSAGTTLGPNLTEVGSRRSAEWMYEWIKNPAIVKPEDRGPNLLPWFTEDKRTEFWPMKPTYMPTIQMTDQERRTIVDYLAGLKVPPVAAPVAETANK